VKNTGSNLTKDDEGTDKNASKWNLAQLAKYFEKIGVNY
jgi:hypothetical protein